MGLEPILFPELVFETSASAIPPLGYNARCVKDCLAFRHRSIRFQSDVGLGCRATLRADGQGFEPRFLGPKPSGLPLTEPSSIANKDIKWWT
jgi:hypothetical protein